MELPLDIIYLLTITITGITAADKCDLNFSCDNEVNCHTCLRKSACCHWYFNENVDQPRCGQLDRMNYDEKFLLKNELSRCVVITNDSFSDYRVGSGQNNDSIAVQLRPQKIDVYMRTGEEVEFKFFYRPARDYPLELYYLTDVSKSMHAGLETVRKLGVGLTTSLNSLTKNHKIAFGTYVEKLAMPFVLMDPNNLEDPCSGADACELAYVFKHKLNFSDVNSFIEAINNSKISANVDNLESGFDALNQILCCHQEIGWSQNSRKLVLITTNSLMHMAGEGLLVGATKRNPGICLIDPNGEYQRSLEYDYPSLAEVAQRLKDRKINLILAADRNHLGYYRQIHQLLPDTSFLGELQEASTNILELVTDGYYKFIRTATFSLNSSAVDGLSARFYSTCKTKEQNNSNLKETNQCDDIHADNTTEFTVKLRLDAPVNLSEVTLNIREQNIHDYIEVRLRFIEYKCEECKATAVNCLNGGYSSCGACVCPEGWTGDSCNVACESKSDKCRDVFNNNIVCSNRGECDCNKCVCNRPYSGSLCQIDCPHSDLQICSNNGHCVEPGVCVCKEGFNGTNCNCSTKQDNCIVPGATLLCNGHGGCVCNRCSCNRGYAGNYCEQCDNCEGFCNIYSPCITKNVGNDSVLERYDCSVENAKVRVELVDQLEANAQRCNYEYYDYDNSKCRIEFTYKLGDQVRVDWTSPVCDRSIPASIQVGVALVAILVPGLFGILFVKIRNWRKDRQEYARFESEQQKGQFEMNQTYRSPITEYRNPMQGRSTD